MPIYLRRFYTTKFIEVKKAEQEQLDKNNKKSSTISRPGITKPFNK